MTVGENAGEEAGAAGVVAVDAGEVSPPYVQRESSGIYTRAKRVSLRKCQ